MVCGIIIIKPKIYLCILFSTRCAVCAHARPHSNSSSFGIIMVKRFVEDKKKRNILKLKSSNHNMHIYAVRLYMVFQSSNSVNTLIDHKSIAFAFRKKNSKNKMVKHRTIENNVQNEFLHTWMWIGLVPFGMSITHKLCWMPAFEIHYKSEILTRKTPKIE